MRWLLTFATFNGLCYGARIPNYFRSASITPYGITSQQVKHDLGPSLSSGTIITGPNDASFANETLRGDLYAIPNVLVVVEPTQEKDIPVIVRYCNQNSIDFMAYSRGYGYPTSLSSFKGLQINLAKLNQISINSDGKSAWLQGGVFGDQVVDYLWDRGYVTTTTTTACIGLGGAGLGGGHGILEGSYGLISDNFLELHIVLGDGSTVVANAHNRYHDLFWAMQGAGHNYGIVTRIKSKIYPAGPRTWHYRKYTWTSDKVVPVFTALNNLHGNGTTPTAMAANFGSFLVVPEISKTEPIIFWTFAFRGPGSAAGPYFAPFDAIESVFTEQGDVPYTQVSHSQEVGLEDPSCGYNMVGIQINTGSKVYNITAEQQLIDAFRSLAATQPDVAAASLAIHEGFATQHVDQVNPDNSAYPWRSSRHLLYYQGIFPPGSPLVDQAIAFGRKVEGIWNAGQPDVLPNTYVNYANGNETLQERYGYEPWRLGKLKKLKAKYDPMNRFRFFNPIIENKHY